LLEEAEAVAVKRVIAWQLKEAMEAKHVSKTEMAAQLCTSRTQVDRLLDPDNVAVSIQTVTKAARTLGLCFCVNFVEEKSSKKRRKKTHHAAAGVSASL